MESSDFYLMADRRISTWQPTTGVPLPALTGSFETGKLFLAVSADCCDFDGQGISFMSCNGIWGRNRSSPCLRDMRDRHPDIRRQSLESA
jgi:hypothetical protein